MVSYRIISYRINQSVEHETKNKSNQPMSDRYKIQRIVLYRVESPYRKYRNVAYRIASYLINRAREREHQIQQISR